jgi:hypothetical protein
MSYYICVGQYDYVCKLLNKKSSATSSIVRVSDEISTDTKNQTHHNSDCERRRLTCIRSRQGPPLCVPVRMQPEYKDGKKKSALVAKSIGPAARQQHKAPSHCALTYIKRLQCIAISLATILRLEQSPSSHDRAHTDLWVHLEYFMSSALSLEEWET